MLGPRALSPYAEGVVLQSPGSAQPRSGEAPPWVTSENESLTPQALYKTFGSWVIFVERLRRTRFLIVTQGARLTTAAPWRPRPWALEYNAYGVRKSPAMSTTRVGPGKTLSRPQRPV